MLLSFCLPYSSKKKFKTLFLSASISFTFNSLFSFLLFAFCTCYPSALEFESGISGDVFHTFGAPSLPFLLKHILADIIKQTQIFLKLFSSNLFDIQTFFLLPLLVLTSSLSVLQSTTYAEYNKNNLRRHT